MEVKDKEWQTKTMIIDIDEQEFYKYDGLIRFLIIEFITRTVKELTSNKFSDFDFKIRTSDGYVIVHLLYGDRDSAILDWQISLQEELNNMVEAYEIDFNEELYDGVLFLVEHRDLWAMED